MKLTPARLATIAAASLLMTACASTPAPTAELAAAESAVARAQNAEIPLDGRVNLTAAREKLELARKAVSNKQNELARRLADEARLDAELALAKSNSQKARAAAEEMQRNIQTLQNEIRYGQGAQ